MRGLTSVIAEIMVPRLSAGLALQSHLQRVRSLTSEQRKRNVGGGVLAIRFTADDETLAVLRFGQHHASVLASQPMRMY